MSERVIPGATITQRTFVGTARVFLAESLLLPTGLLTAAYLARRLGPEAYGLFAVAAAIIAWIEWSLTALFARTSVKLVADARSWQQIGSTILSVHLFASLAGALLLFLLASPLAILFHKPELAGYMRLFAIDIPLFCQAQAHRNILVGLGRYSAQALAAATRWVSRLVLVVVLVQLGLSVEGAILGYIGASVIELGVARYFIRPEFSARATLQITRLWGLAVPLLLSSLALRFYDKLDLVTLTALGGTARQAGLYGGAQNLAIFPSLFATSFSPLLLSALSRAFRDGKGPLTQALVRDGMRAGFLVTPFAALAAGSATEIVTLVYGRPFAPAGSFLSWLIFAAVALLQVSVATAILIAANRPQLTLALTGPLPLIALVGYLSVIPRWGPEGAAPVTFVSATVFALAAVVAVSRVCEVRPPGGTIVRSSLLAGVSYAGAILWATPGFMLAIKLAVMTIGILIAFGLLGEFSKRELTTLRALVRRDPSIEP
jgi:O-antigen/teichoic acid export membrane protein